MATILNEPAPFPIANPVSCHVWWKSTKNRTYRFWVNLCHAICLYVCVQAWEKDNMDNNHVGWRWMESVSGERKRMAYVPGAQEMNGICVRRTVMAYVSAERKWIAYMEMCARPFVNKKHCFFEIVPQKSKKMWITIVCAKFQNCVNTTQKWSRAPFFRISLLHSFFVDIQKKNKLVTPELPPLKHVRTGERPILWEYVWRTILTGVCGEQLSKPPKQVSIPRPFHLDPYPVLGSLVSADISTRTMSIMVQIQLGIQDQQVPEPKWGIRRVKNGKFHGMR